MATSTQATPGPFHRFSTLSFQRFPSLFQMLTSPHLTAAAPDPAPPAKPPTLLGRLKRSLSLLAPPPTKKAAASPEEYTFGSRELREAALRERGLLPPVEAEGEDVVVVKEPETPSGEMTEARKIKEEWEQRARASEERNPIGADDAQASHPDHDGETEGVRLMYGEITFVSCNHC